MGFKSHDVHGEPRPRRRLSEAVRNAPFGTMVGWQTPAGRAYGVVVGQDGKELLCLSAFSKSLAKDKSLTYYEDAAASGKLQQAMPGVLMALQRVPMARAFKRGRIEGTGLQPYMKAAAHLQLESEEESGMDYGKLNEQLDAINESLQEAMPLASAGKGKAFSQGIHRVVLEIGDVLQTLEAFRGLITYRLIGRGSGDVSSETQRRLGRVSGHVDKLKSALKTAQQDAHVIKKMATQLDSEMGYN